MLISIIIPVYNEQDNLRPLFSALRESFAGKPEYRYEVVFVDDFSTDNSFDILSEFATSPDYDVRVIRLARNSGSHVALSAGLQHCSGDVAVYIAADLQCSPEAIFKLIEKHMQGYPIVWGVRDSREDKWIIRLFSSIYYRVLEALVKQVIHFSDIETFLIHRKVIDQFQDVREKNTNILLLIACLGFKQDAVVVEHCPRRSGKSGWTISRKIKLLIDSLVSFSYMPIRAISLFGIFFSLCGFAWAVLEIILYLQDNSRPLGYTSIFVLILLVSGLQLLMLGVVGEYLWRAFDQISSKPMIVIDEMLGFKTKHTDIEQVEENQ
jgi:polyisoprenyl-phosphate glycosyltransferase